MRSLTSIVLLRILIEGFLIYSIVPATIMDVLLISSVAFANILTVIITSPSL